MFYSHKIIEHNYVITIWSNTTITTIVIITIDKHEKSTIKITPTDAIEVVASTQILVATMDLHQGTNQKVKNRFVSVTRMDMKIKLILLL